MNQEPIAYILCTKQTNPNRVIAGLTVGERLLLSLSYGGVKQAVFLGDGEKPTSERASISVVERDVASLPAEQEIIVLPADLVFDRALLKNCDALHGNLPVRKVSAGALQHELANLSEFVTSLGNGQAATGHGYAIRAMDVVSVKRAQRALYLSLIKPIDGVISKAINRKVSLAITRLLIRTPISPNGLTIAIMFLGVFSGVAAYFAEHWWALVLAGVLFQTQSMLDGCDGEIARLKYQFSTKGQWLDSIGDDVTNYIFCLGVALGQARIHGWDWLYILGWVVFAVQWYASFLMYQRIYKMNTGDLLAIPNMVSSGEPKGKMGALVRFVHTLTKRDFFVFVTSIFAAVQLPLVSFGLIAGGSFLMAPSLTVNELRIRKAIKAGELDLRL